MRVSVPALDKILGEQIPVLDHGFVQPVDYMGADCSLAQSARISYGPGTKTIHDDRGLIRYLFRHRHTSPLESCEIRFNVRAPIFVIRQWLRHRTANVNEESARYSEVKEEYYVPAVGDIHAQSKANNQGRGDLATTEDAEWFADQLAVHSNEGFGVYRQSLGAVAREIARLPLSLNTYSSFSWKIDLHNLFHFLKLRADPNAQLEIRAYAEAILSIVEVWCPIAFDAFRDYAQEAVTFSRMEMEIVRKMVAASDTGSRPSDMSPREWTEFQAKLSG